MDGWEGGRMGKRMREHLREQVDNEGENGRDGLEKRVEKGWGCQGWKWETRRNGGEGTGWKEGKNCDQQKTKSNKTVFVICGCVIILELSSTNLAGVVDAHHQDARAGHIQSSRVTQLRTLEPGAGEELFLDDVHWNIGEKRWWRGINRRGYVSIR